MHFVYIVGTGSRWNNRELLFSLRSLEKFAPIASVTIVGNVPPFARNVVRLPIPETGVEKAERVGRKLLAALPSLPAEFVLMNDDFYLLRPLETLPAYHLGRLAVVRTKGAWNRRRAESREILERRGILAPLDFSVHAPFPVEREKVQALAQSIDFTRRGLFRTLYGNMFRESLELRHTRDCKTGGPPRSSWPFYSTRGLVSKPVREFLRATFNQPSRFERQEHDTQVDASREARTKRRILLATRSPQRAEGRLVW